MKQLNPTITLHRILLFTAVGSMVALAVTTLGLLRGLSAALDSFGIPWPPQ